jgi:hypothetical protein
MVEIKIAVSDRMNHIIQDISEDIGIKKSEFVKSLVIEKLKEISLKKRRNQK